VTEATCDFWRRASRGLSLAKAQHLLAEGTVILRAA